MARAPGGKLLDEHKAFVVVRLACYDSPKEVAQALKGEYGIVLTPQGCEAYDPTKSAGRRLSEKWRALFKKTRDDFHANIERYVPEANRMVRVRHLANAASALKERGNYVGMADMLERIAKEIGNVHSNRREVSAPNGGPIQVEVNAADAADLRAEMNAILGPLLAATVQPEPGGSDEQDD